MIKYVKGNIFDSKCSILVNPVNCVGVMGKGLALQFKERYPEVFEKYQKFCKFGKLLPGGTPVYVMTKDSTKTVLLFPTKNHWKDKSKLEDIDKSLLRLRDTIIAGFRSDSFAFPKIGCGLGGLDWETEVKPLMERYLGDLDVMIEVYE